jgi:hypothetical protein
MFIDFLFRREHHVRLSKPLLGIRSQASGLPALGTTIQWIHLSVDSASTRFIESTLWLAGNVVTHPLLFSRLHQQMPPNCQTNFSRLFDGTFADQLLLAGRPQRTNALERTGLVWNFVNEDSGPLTVRRHASAGCYPGSVPTLSTTNGVEAHSPSLPAVGSGHVAMDVHGQTRRFTWLRRRVQRTLSTYW